MSGEDHTLEFLLSFDGQIHQLGGHYWLKFVARKVAPTPGKPHGIGYSLTLHAPDNERIFGIDNDHGVDHPGGRYMARPATYDHLHRHEADRGRPYVYTNAAQLLGDFFEGVKRRLLELGLDENGDPL